MPTANVMPRAQKQKQKQHQLPHHNHKHTHTHLLGAASRTPSLKLASSSTQKRRSFSSHGAGLLNKMFGSSATGKTDDGDTTMTSPVSPSPASNANTLDSTAATSTTASDRVSPERKPASDAAPPSAATSSNLVTSPATEKKRRSSSVAKAKEIFTSAKQAFNPRNDSSPVDKTPQTPIQKLSKADPALGVPQGPQNNSAGESLPGPRSTFRVGVTEDKNKKCRRTMEDTHAYLYNFLSTPQVSTGVTDGDSKAESLGSELSEKGVAETDNGYFAIFDGHAGTFAADWCGKKLHHILEEIIRKNPSTPIPELLDQTFTSVDQQLEKLPLKNSGCTAVIAVLRWEDRVPNPASATGSTYLNSAAAKSAQGDKEASDAATTSVSNSDTTAASVAQLTQQAARQRVLYTANVGDARIVLCRNGRALRLSYDHKGSDEQEGRRVANAGGLILNNRVNGVLAVTRALGDAYMKDLVTGHPYTTETVIQPDQDEFLILACDGLWDVCSDQEAVDLVRNTHDAQAASKALVDHALARFSTDNLSCMIVRFDNAAIRAHRSAHNIGVEGDPETLKGTISEADAIVGSVKKLQEEGVVSVGGPTPNAIDEREAQEKTGEGRDVGAPELNADAVEEARRKKEESAREQGPGS